MYKFTLKEDTLTKSKKVHNMIFFHKKLQKYL